MSSKLNVGITKTVGQPESHSLCATCQIESSVMNEDTEVLHRQIRDAFTACRQAVEEELGRSMPNQNGSGRQNHPQDTGTRGRKDRPATPSQVRAIHAIANRQRLDLAAERV